MSSSRDWIEVEVLVPSPWSENEFVHHERLMRHNMTLQLFLLPIIDCTIARIELYSYYCCEYCMLALNNGCILWCVFASRYAQVMHNDRVCWLLEKGTKKCQLRKRLLYTAPILSRTY